MATRSLICYKSGDEITVSYCHWDGYIAGGVGETLFNCYSTEEAAEFFKTGHDMSALGKTPERSEIRENSKFVPDKFVGSIDEFAEAIGEGEYDSLGAELVYIFEDGEWLVGFISCALPTPQFAPLENLIEE